MENSKNSPRRRLCERSCNLRFTLKLDRPLHGLILKPPLQVTDREFQAIGNPHDSRAIYVAYARHDWQSVFPIILSLGSK